jgi:hypothetical protein
MLDEVIKGHTDDKGKATVEERGGYHLLEYGADYAVLKA